MQDRFLELKFMRGDLKNIESKDDGLSFFFEAYYSNLCFYANSFMRDFELSRDLVQDVFLKLWDKRELQPDSTEMEAYLYRSVKNRCLDQLKRNQIKDKYRASILYLVSQEEKCFSDPLEQQEIIDQIEKAISTFPQLTVKIFDLSRNKGMKYHQIAAELEISVKTVEAHISKALKILRFQLKDYLPETLLIAFLIDVL